MLLLLIWIFVLTKSIRNSHTTLHTKKSYLSNLYNNQKSNISDLWQVHPRSFSDLPHHSEGYCFKNGGEILLS